MHHINTVLRVLSAAAAVLLVASSSLAQPADEAEPSDPPVEETEPLAEPPTHATIQVNGMVCGFCASGVERVFSRVDAIDEISVSLDDGTLEIELVPGVEITEEEIRSLLEDAGYEVVAIEWRTEGS